MTIHSNYLGRVLDPSRLKRHIAQAVTDLAAVDFDAIAVTGSSGLIFGGALSLALGKPLLLVRKRNDCSHSINTPVEGDLDSHRYLFVDDQVSSGDTRRRVRRAIEHFNPNAVYVGTYEYDEDRFSSPERDVKSIRSSAKRPLEIYDSFGDVSGLEPDPKVVVTVDLPTPPPIIKEVTANWRDVPQWTPSGSLPYPSPVEGPSLSDDPTVIKEPPDVVSSELYNTAAFNRGG